MRPPLPYYLYTISRGRKEPSSWPARADHWPLVIVFGGHVTPPIVKHSPPCRYWARIRDAASSGSSGVCMCNTHSSDGTTQAVCKIFQLSSSLLLSVSVAALLQNLNFGHTNTNRNATTHIPKIMPYNFSRPNHPSSSLMRRKNAMFLLAASIPLRFMSSP